MKRTRSLYVEDSLWLAVQREARKRKIPTGRLVEQWLSSQLGVEATTNAYFHIRNHRHAEDALALV
jgi:hypothetical protein